MEKKYSIVPEAEIAVDNYEDAIEIVRVLLNNNYCVMLSKEDCLYVISYVWASLADRNEVAFMSRDDFEDALFSYSTAKTGSDLD